MFLHPFFCMDELDLQLDEDEEEEKKLDLLDPVNFYRNRILNAVHVYTGCSTVGEGVLEILEKRLKSYLIKIHTASVKEKDLRRTNAKGKVNKVTPTDMFNALKGTLEYYGAKRCMLIKLMSKKLNEKADKDLPAVVETNEKKRKGKKCEDPDAGNASGKKRKGKDGKGIAEEQEDSKGEREDDLSSLQIELAKLNDKTLESIEFKTELDLHMKRTDALTRIMTKEEYLDYSRVVKQQFIKKKKIFCAWMGWSADVTIVHDEIFTIFGWLAGFKIRNMLQKALKRRNDLVVRSLFSNSPIQYDRIVKLEKKFVVNRSEYDKIEKEEDSRFVKDIEESYRKREQQRERDEHGDKGKGKLWLLLQNRNKYQEEQERSFLLQEQRTMNDSAFSQEERHFRNEDEGNFDLYDLERLLESDSTLWNIGC
jgi:hypothetical protein